MTRTHRAVLATLAVVLAPLALSACGAEAGEPEVASLPSSTGASSSPDPTGPADGDDERGPDGRPTGTSVPTIDNQADSRPVFRVDDTEARRKQIWNAYNSCLLDNGASKPEGDGLAIALGDVIVDYQSAPRESLEACAALEPVQPPALEAATNPRFREQTLAYVQCMQDRGLWVTLLNDDNTDWTYTAGHTVPDDSAQVEQDCLVASYGDQ